MRKNKSPKRKKKRVFGWPMICVCVCVSSVVMMISQKGNTIGPSFVTESFRATRARAAEKREMASSSSSTMVRIGRSTWRRTARNKPTAADTQKKKEDRSHSRENGCRLAELMANATAPRPSRYDCYCYVTALVNGPVMIHDDPQSGGHSSFLLYSDCSFYSVMAVPHHHRGT